MSIAVMNRIAELEKRIEILEAAQRRDAVLDYHADDLPRKQGRPRKHDVPQTQKGEA